jgi:phage tail-like protein
MPFTSPEMNVRSVCKDMCGDLLAIYKKGNGIIRIYVDEARSEEHYLSDGSTKFAALSTSTAYVYAGDSGKKVYVLPWEIIEPVQLGKYGVLKDIRDLAAAPDGLYILAGKSIYRMEAGGGEADEIKVSTLISPRNLFYEAPEKRLVITGKGPNKVELLYLDDLENPVKLEVDYSGLAGFGFEIGPTSDLVGAAPDPDGGLLLAIRPNYVVKADYPAEGSGGSLVAKTFFEVADEIVDINEGPRPNEITVLAGDGFEGVYGLYIDIYKIEEEPRADAELGKTAYVKTVPSALDSKEDDTVWHKVTVDADYYPPEANVTVYYFASNSTDAAKLPDYKPGEEEPSADAISEKRLWLGGHKNPPSFLCRDAEGRYLYLCLRMEWNAEKTPMVRSLTVEFPRNTYLQYLPVLYQKDKGGKKFLEGYLSIFEDVIGRREEDIYRSDLLAVPSAVDEPYLRWLAGWLGIVVESEWTHEEVFAFVEVAPEYYRRRGTKYGLYTVLRIFIKLRPDDLAGEVENFEQYTYGYRYRAVPKIVEAFEVENVAAGEEEGEAARAPYVRLFAPNEFCFTVMLPGYLGFNLDARSKIARVLYKEKPAHTRVCIAYLWPAYVLDAHTYLGVNTILVEPHHVLGDWWMPIDSVLAASHVAAGSELGSVPQATT